MKKHIFGLALFSFIFASFAFTFAYFYAAALPQIAVVKQPVFVPEGCCRTLYSSDYTYLSRNLECRILNSEFNLDSNEFVSQISLKWNSDEKRPEKIFLSIDIKTDKENYFYLKEVINKPFAANNETKVTVKSRLTRDALIDRKKNLYASMLFSLNGSSTGSDEVHSRLLQRHEVLLVHGNRSIIRK